MTSFACQSIQSYMSVTLNQSNGSIYSSIDQSQMIYHTHILTQPMQAILTNGK